LSTALVGLTVPGCLARADSASNRGTPSPTERTDTDVSHPDLSVRLTHVANAANPGAYATERGYRVRDGAIQVVVEVRPDGALPDTYIESVEYRHESLYEVLVRFEDLVPLASHEAVTSVRLPVQPATNDND
jgi:hypothetical protein